MIAGREDAERAASALASRLPWPLGVLGRLAYNYRWAWLPDGPEIFRLVDPVRWRLCGGNPVRLLQEASSESLLRAAADTKLIAAAEAAERAIAEDLARPARTDAVDEERPVAFFCAEYAVHQSLPIYSGGLGALAGDIVKEASDMALPFVAVGLMYRRGYFRQRIDGTGWQQEFWGPTDPERTPAALVTEGPERTPLKITVPIGGRDVVAQIWRVNVGRVPLFLLDAEVPENNGVSRWITSRLYDGDPGTRLEQYTLLGVGGIIALRALGIEPGVVHMNEGHAALTALETARGAVAGGANFDDALADARERTVFTTHTPVPAGNDTYPPDQVRATLDRLLTESGTDADAFLRLGRTNPDDEGEPFGVTQLALRASRAANGVAKRHGIVSRGMWQGMWPDRDVDDVPIGHVTNGVHVPTWVSPAMAALYVRFLGADWRERTSDEAFWDAVAQIPDEELWAARQLLRSELFSFVRERARQRWAGEQASPQRVLAAGTLFDPNALTIGFARRFTSYKRPELIFHDAERLAKILNQTRRPVQIVFAGKAHPADDMGKHHLHAIFKRAIDPAFGGRVAFVDDYDLHVAHYLVSGVDVWLNNPRKPLEASGTSGMKAAINGVPHMSIGDGWWAEGHNGANGWLIDGRLEADAHSHDAVDAADAEALYTLLEQEVVPAFYQRDRHGIPDRWLTIVRESIRSVTPRFSARRMVLDYVERAYAPAYAAATRPTDILG